MSATVNMAEEEALCPVCGCLLEEDGAFATVRQPCGCIACRPCATTLLSISLSESAQDPRCMLCHGALPDLAGRGSEGVGAFVDTLPTGAPNAAHQEQVQFLGELPSGALWAPSPWAEPRCRLRLPSNRLRRSPARNGERSANVPRFAPLPVRPEGRRCLRLGSRLRCTPQLPAACH